MNKMFRKLGAGGLGVAAGVLLLGFSGVATVSAESPPNPPARFAGTVTVNGAPAAAGTTVEAKIGSTTCGVTTVFSQGGNGNYVLDSPALDPGANPNCGTENAAVSFFVGGQKANETGSWKNYQLNQLNLTVTTATATPTGTASPTPKAPVTGSGSMSESGSSSTWMFAILGLGALAFGATGVAAARRSR